VDSIIRKEENFAADAAQNWRMCAQNVDLEMTRMMLSVVVVAPNWM
jgi:hypothetical protein